MTIFGEQPSSDPHGACALEITTLREQVAALTQENEQLRADAVAADQDAEIARTPPCSCGEYHGKFACGKLSLERRKL